jgi:hypothetical protein
MHPIKLLARVQSVLPAWYHLKNCSIQQRLSVSRFLSCNRLVKRSFASSDPAKAKAPGGQRGVSRRLASLIQILFRAKSGRSSAEHFPTKRQEGDFSLECFGDTVG